MIFSSQKQDESRLNASIVSRPCIMSDDEDMPQTRPMCDVIEELRQAMLATQVVITRESQDVFAGWQLEQIEEARNLLSQARVILQQEELLFTGFDLDGKDEAELRALLEVTRESSRKLSITLAHGQENEPDADDDAMQFLQTAADFEDYLGPQLWQLLRRAVELVGMAQARRPAYHISPKDIEVSPHAVDSYPFSLQPSTSLSISHDAAGSGVERVKALAKMARQISDFLDQLTTSHEEISLGSIAKVNAVEKIKKEADALVPLIKKHVLRVGLGKKHGQYNLHDIDNISSLFGSAAIDSAHKEVERLREELLKAELRHDAKRARLAE